MNRFLTTASMLAVLSSCTPAFAQTWTIDLTGTETDGTAVHFHEQMNPQYAFFYGMDGAADYITGGEDNGFPLGAFMLGDVVAGGQDAGCCQFSSLTWDNFFVSQGAAFTGGISFYSDALTPSQNANWLPDVDGDYLGTGTWFTGSLGVVTFTEMVISDPPDASNVPEPSAWALLLAGFGLIGFAIRSRRGLLALRTH